MQMFCDKAELSAFKAQKRLCDEVISMAELVTAILVSVGLTKMSANIHVNNRNSSYMY